MKETKLKFIRKPENFLDMTLREKVSYCLFAEVNYTNKEIADYFGISRQQIGNFINKLQEEGEYVRIAKLEEKKTKGIFYTKKHYYFTLKFFTDFKTGR